MVELQRQVLSRDNPWPGLDPFDETDREYFHGRAAESGELLRLVRREPLTVVFGRSGLGKTSLLKAGLFPLLRGEDCLPVYVRLDHAEGTPALREQIFRALQTACDGDRVQAAQPAGEETLWSFFHRRDAEFWSERNRPVTPVIVFDQFEEIFTLGQETEAARARSAAFLAELGDLVENRPPDAVRAALEADSTAARSFDFKRSKVKLVLSFREDFLAEMEGLKERMPSLMYNRFRLLAMSGAQAYEVIIRAGGHLAGDDIARRIIRLAWKNEPSPPVDPSDFPAIEIDPALLSVVCSELNHKRQQAKLEHITPALLEGADREILSGFYERGMAGLDPRVRAFVEDELITDRGYRDSHDMEDALALPGVTSAAIDALIGRRLLRVDDRQSMRRLELTHDVLTRVVRDSRDSRRAREAEEAVKVRERAALAQQRRNRRNGALVGAGAFVVLVLIVLAGTFLVVARRAERRAAMTENMARLAEWRAAKEAAKAHEERKRATALGIEADSQKRKTGELLREAESTRLMANADQLQDGAYDASLLVNLEAVRATPTLDSQAGLLRRFVSHPHLSSFLRGHKDDVYSVTFSPDGKQLASASEDKTVILWDVVKRKPLATLEGHTSRVWAVAFSRDGVLASASQDKTVILWNAARRERLATLEGHTDEVYGVAFSLDGKQLASASKDNTVILWDVAKGEALDTLKWHTSGVRGVAFSRDGKLASASEDKTVILWDVADRKRLATLKGNRGAVYGVAFSPNGKRLAAVGGGYMSDPAVILWDVKDKPVDSEQPLAVLEGHKDGARGVVFSPDGTKLASVSADKTVILWDVDVVDKKPLATLEGHKSWVWGVAFSPDGTRLASASYDDTVILWDVDRRKSLATLEGGNSAESIAFSPKGRRLAAASGDNVILWNMKKRKPPITLEGKTKVAFSPDGELASVGGWDKDDTVILWDVKGRKPLATLGHQDAVWGMDFSPKGRRLASASRNNTVILWDLASRKPLATPERHKEAVRDVAFSPDGKRLASASDDHTVILWDVDSRKPLATLRHKDSVLDVAFSPDGKQLASASADHTVILWDVERRKPLATLKGHEGRVWGVAFGPDGKRLASASWDETVILWDVDRRKPLVTLRHEGRVWGVAFSPDGKRLAAGSQTMTLWDLDPDHLQAEACRTANRNLTCEEWRSYLGADKPYRKTCESLPGPPEKCD